MAEDGLVWIYLIFLLIPLSKFLPRLIKKWKMKNSSMPEQVSPDEFQVVNNSPRASSESFDEQTAKESKPKSLDMLVLSELNHGTKNFDALQKHLGIDNETLDSVLEDLEKKGLMRVEQKKGLLGPKVELYPTEKGMKKYFS